MTEISINTDETIPVFQCGKCKQIIPNSFTKKQLRDKNSDGIITLVCPNSVCGNLVNLFKVAELP